MFIRRMALVLLVLSWGVGNGGVGLAQAGWIKVDGSDGLTVYGDPTTRHIDQKRGLVTIWTLLDYKTAQTFNSQSFLSIRGKQQFDCKEERSRTLASEWFKGNMEKGRMVRTDYVEGTWTPVPPRTIAEAMLNLACGTAKR